MSNIKRSITPNDPADFTPTREQQIPLQPFRYWCQKILPLVYDDSLSYYELLCKVVDYLNKTMEDVTNMDVDITNLLNAYNQLQEYVNNYFSTLDVQEEINNKLDNMVEDGTLDCIFAKYFSLWLNPDNFGAVGDGVTDDSKAINSCITEAINTNLPVVFSPNKTYYIDNSISINNYVNILKTSAKIKVAENVTGIVINCPSAVDRQYLNNSFKISVNLECIGGIGIHIVSGYSITFENCSIKNAKVGIQVDASAELSFINIRISGNANGDYGIIDNGGDNSYINIFMYNCFTGFTINKWVSIIHLHCWMDKNFNNSIGVETNASCYICNSYIDSYAIKIYNKASASLYICNTDFYTSAEFYNDTFNVPILFYCDNNNAFRYSFFVNCIYESSVKAKLSNIPVLNTNTINCRFVSITNNSALNLNKITLPDGTVNIPDFEETNVTYNAGRYTYTINLYKETGFNNLDVILSGVTIPKNFTCLCSLSTEKYTIKAIGLLNFATNGNINLNIMGETISGFTYLKAMETIFIN